MGHGTLPRTPVTPPPTTVEDGATFLFQIGVQRQNKSHQENLQEKMAGFGPWLSFRDIHVKIPNNVFFNIINYNNTAYICRGLLSLFTY